MPGVQKPHCVPPIAARFSCRSRHSPPSLKPSMVVICAPGASTASIRQALTGVAVDHDRAGAAIAVAATFLGAGQAEPVAQPVEQGVARIGEAGDFLTVHLRGDRRSVSCAVLLRPGRSVAGNG